MYFLKHLVVGDKAKRNRWFFEHHEVLSYANYLKQYASYMQTLSKMLEFSQNHH